MASLSDLCSWRTIAIGSFVLLSACGDGRGDEDTLSAADLEGKTATMLWDGTRVVEPKAPSPSDTASEASAEGALASIDAAAALAAGPGGLGQPDVTDIEKQLMDALADTQGKIMQAFKRQGEWVQLFDGLEYSSMLLEVNELGAPVGKGSDAIEEASFGNPADAALTGKAPARPQGCWQKHTYRFSSARAYALAKRHNATHGHNINTHARRYHKHFIRPGHPASAHALVHGMTGHYTYNDTAREIGVMQKVPGVSCGCGPNGKDIPLDFEPTIDTKGLPNWPLWAKAITITAVGFGTRFVVTAAIMAAQPELAVQANIIGSCVGAGVSAALTFAWAKQPWWQALVAGIGGCVVGGAGAKYWRPFGEWARGRAVAFGAVLLRYVPSFDIAPGLEAAFENGW